MKRFYSLLPAMALAVGQLLSAAPSAVADEKGWGLMQQSPHAGLIYLYLTPHGIAIVIQKTGATIVTHAPAWQVVMYNKQTKVYYTCTMDELGADLSDNPKARKEFGQIKETTPPKRGMTATIAGLKATQYLVKTQTPNGLKSGEFWVTDQVAGPPQLKQLLGTIYQLSAQDLPNGVPMRVKLFDDTGKKQLVVDTTKCVPQVIHDASFVAPANYKRVDNELLVVLDEKSKRAMESITEDSSSSSDELNALLGSSGRSRSHPSSYRPTSTCTRPAYSSPTTTAVSGSAARSTVSQSRPQAPQTATTSAKAGDWFNNLFSSMGKK